MIFENFIVMLDAWGVTDVLLPFILVFTIVFATMQKTKILGEGKKNFNVIIALVMGLGVVIPHVVGRYPFNFDPVDVINTALPQVSIILVAILMLLLIIGVFGNEIDFAGTPLSGWIVIIAIIAVVGIFGSSVGWFRLPLWLLFLQDPELQALIVMILIFGIIIYFITKEDKKEQKELTGMRRFTDGFNQVMKPKK
ncbi:hypothetical protein JW756_01220 [Candidatus Woesearchaeota archaeon]|nr:hypothetical protein [Candidatus Woesearchaeota archaeon]